MVAQLGEIVFEVLKSPGQVCEIHKWNFAEHAVMDDKPHLQKTGQGLIELNLGIRLSVFLGFEPQEFLDLLYNEADQKTALPFILGTGQVLGEFVILQVQKEWKKVDNQGNLLCVDLEIQLKEYR